MDTTGIIKQLTEERDRIDEVIRILSGSEAKAPTADTTKTGRKPMSDAARQRMAEAQRKRWAKAKKGK